ncbi:hypothetical protein LCGC14_2974880 [marine sediment metagenome]|uniref:Uncharacterized protein n=1 Tax=marine sediment metagenome TaxID=412755 RepID=A0A0F8X8D5_9ZZZZ
MVKTETILCDVCKEKIGISKCSICDKDLCSSCWVISWLEVNGVYPDGSGTFGRYTLYFCGNCHSKLVSNTSSNKPLLENEFLKKLSKKTINHIKRKLILNNLENTSKEDL